MSAGFISCHPQSISINATVHIYYPLAVLPGAEEFSFDVQLQLLMERKRKLAQNLLAAPAFKKEDYQQLLEKTLGFAA
ncbi:MAG: hypothetical protein L6Q55_06685 [Azonexus sp.]|nr:hypothetical protein [Azonexus sp.]MCK6412097.1 hypothetical protein [Azonexus sp.]